MATHTDAGAGAVHPEGDAYPSSRPADDFQAGAPDSHERWLHRLTAVACLVVAVSWVADIMLPEAVAGNRVPVAVHGWMLALGFAALGVAAVTMQLDLGLGGWAARTTVACGLLAAVLGAISGVWSIITGAELGSEGVSGFMTSVFAVWAIMVSWQARSHGGYSGGAAYIGFVVGAVFIGSVVIDLRGSTDWFLAAFVLRSTGAVLLPFWFTLLGTVHVTDPHPQRHDGRVPAAKPRLATNVLAGILAFASLALGILALPAVGLMAIGFADLGGAARYPNETDDFLSTQFGVLAGAMLGILTLALRPRHLWCKLLAGVGIGASVYADYLFCSMYFGA